MVFNITFDVAFNLTFYGGNLLGVVAEYRSKRVQTLVALLRSRSDKYYLEKIWIISSKLLVK